ncbi:MAG: RluA family pseudouridine synthase [Verrucomicrobiae bacterium]|nr:RluA family pseudouridine synthase [Verrucomicrobiae bacterium]
MKLVELVQRRFPDSPRTRIKKWIEQGRVRVNGVVIRQASAEVVESAEVELAPRHELAWTPRPPRRIHSHLSVLYLDRDLAVVNKAAGLLAVPAPGQPQSALRVFGAWLAGDESPPMFRRLRPMPVHRLDQYTSGVLCFAMNPTARAHLIDQFAKHTVGRTYLAFVEGQPAAMRGTWRHLVRFDEDKMRQRVVGQVGEAPRRAGTVEAITHYEVVEQFGPVTKLRLRLETGRTHQIRVQAAQEGLPLLGDRRYHPRGGGDWIERQALHAESLELTHPATQQRVTWRAPMPADLVELERRLQRELVHRQASARRSEARRR